MISDYKDITLINTDNRKNQIEKLTQAINENKKVLRYKFNDNLDLEFNFLDVWLILFSKADAMAQCEYKELLNEYGYVLSHQVQCIADCYKSIDLSLLNSLIYDCYTGRQSKEL